MSNPAGGARQHAMLWSRFRTRAALWCTCVASCSEQGVRKPWRAAPCGDSAQGLRRTTDRACRHRRGEADASAQELNGTDGASQTASTLAAVWLDGVDIPDELVQAAREGTLVLFVGAGASRDQPSGLPDFRLLTSTIADDARIAYEDVELDNPDVLLGRIDDEDVDVHQRVQALIDQPGRSHNRLHEAIIELAVATGSPRIVTTNYDLHLTSASAARGAAWDEHRAPALPMGDDFSGIVYLHGNLRQEARHLIVTDGDFGRAYLRDAWAARFLERMFATFHVLFIGYSHGDMVMRYLARSLGPNSSRYVLTADPDAPDWRRLRVRPIEYELRGSSHAAIGDAVTKWARLLSMGLLDHRQQIAQLVAAPPTSVPDEQSYLTSVVGDDQLLSLFVELAGGEAWVRWAVAQPAGRALFDPQSPRSDGLWKLAQWFAAQCLASEELARSGLSLLADAGGRMSIALWHALGQQLHGQPSPRPAWMQPWIVAMVESAPREGRDWLEYALVACALPDEREIALVLFDYLTEPHAVTAPSLGFGGSARVEVTIRGDDHWLGEAWESLLLPNLSPIVHDVLAIAERHLRRARQLAIAAGAAGPGWDPLSFSRSSIAPHEQDRYGDRVGVLIDAARDSIELLAATDPEATTSYVKSWSSSDSPILKRLAIHAVTVDNTRSANEKVEWLVDHGLLFDHQLRHEIFALLATGLPSADESTVERLVDTAKQGPESVEEDETRAYEAFNALVWIEEHSGTASAATALEAARAANPTFAVREHPDFSSWSEVGARGYIAPMPTEELQRLLAENRSAALDRLMELKEVRFSIGSASWDDALSLVTNVVRDDPATGFELLGPDADLDGDLISAVIRGWATSELTDDLARQVIERLRSPELGTATDEIARLLGGYGRQDGKDTWPRVAEARALAREIERRLELEPLPEGASDWLMKAINTSGGLLAEFWLRAVSHDWNSDRDGWTGLGDASRESIEYLLQRDDLHGALAEVVVASQLHFFFAADPDWAQATIMPMLDWDDPERARRTWDGFLIWGRWTDRSLDAGLRHHYLGAVRHADELRDELRRQLAEHLAGIALYSEHDPLDWIPDFVVAASESDRVAWHNQIAWMLERLDPDARHSQWNRWMQTYWTRRLQSVPSRLTRDEATALAGWVVHLDSSIEEAVELAVAVPAGIAEHGDILHELGEHAERAPAAYARLLGHLLANTEPPFRGCYHLPDIVSKLRELANEDDIRRIREESIRLGCVGAADW